MGDKLLRKYVIDLYNLSFELLRKCALVDLQIFDNSFHNCLYLIHSSALLKLVVCNFSV